MFYTWLEVGKERGLLQNFNTSLNDLRLKIIETVKTLIFCVHLILASFMFAFFKF